MTEITKTTKATKTSDSYKQGVECWIRGKHGNHENYENHGNPGCKSRAPQTTGLETHEYNRNDHANPKIATSLGVFFLGPSSLKHASKNAAFYRGFAEGVVSKRVVLVDVPWTPKTGTRVQKRTAAVTAPNKQRNRDGTKTRNEGTFAKPPFYKTAGL